ncbi:MAG TPA: hypothetical protein DCL83_02190 [Arthrobacter bacterium]|nr:hypothetical protein [Arthrobacter sp.]
MPPRTLCPWPRPWLQELVFALSCQGIALLGNAERGVLRHIHVENVAHVQDGGEAIAHINVEVGF